MVLYVHRQVVGISSQKKCEQKRWPGSGKEKKKRIVLPSIEPWLTLGFSLLTVPFSISGP